MVEIPSVFVAANRFEHKGVQYVVAGEAGCPVLIAIEPDADDRCHSRWACMSHPMPPPGWRVKYVVDRKYFFCEQINVA